MVTTSWRGNTVNLIDADGVLPTERIALDLRPDGIELDPAGSVLAVSSLEADGVALVDLAARRQTARIVGLATPHHLSFSPDGRRLYVANLGANRVTEIDVAAGAVAREIELAPAEEDLGGVTNVTVLAGGREALVAFGSGSELALVDLVAGVVRRRVPVGELPWHAFATQDGRRLLVPNNGDGTVSVLDGSSLAEIARIPAGADITGVNIGWFETVAFVLSRAGRTATVIDLEHGQALGEVILPGAPEAGVTTADGSRIYVALGDVGRRGGHRRARATAGQGDRRGGASTLGRADGGCAQLLSLNRHTCGNLPVGPVFRPASEALHLAAGFNVYVARLPDDLDATPPPAHHHSGTRTLPGARSDHGRARPARDAVDRARAGRRAERRAGLIGQPARRRRRPSPPPHRLLDVPAG